MEVVRSRYRPRCADCDSSAVILHGDSVWHLPSQSWRAVQPKLEQSPSGLITAIDPRIGFFCQDCETHVAIRMGKG